MQESKKGPSSKPLEMYLKCVRFIETPRTTKRPYRIDELDKKQMLFMAQYVQNLSNPFTVDLLNTFI